MAMPPETALFHQIHHPQKRALLLAYSECLSIPQSAAHAHVDRSLHFHWLKSDPEYAVAFEEAKQMGAEALETEAVRRAKEGVQRTLFYKGEPIGTETVYSDTLLIFLLKGAYPEKYRERFEVHQRVLMDILVKIQRPTDLSDADLERLLVEAQTLVNEPS